MSSTRRASAARVGAALLLVLAVAAPVTAHSKHRGPWGPAVLEVGINSAFADGCPIESFNGLHLYLASNRDPFGGPTDPNDIYRASRKTIHSPWTTPVRLAAPVNSAWADFCPTPLKGKRLYFVSARVQAGACGAGDIYRTRERRHGWETPTNLGCAADGSGPNLAGGEFSPSIVKTRAGTILFYSSTASSGGVQDIYSSTMRADGTFGPGTAIPELNTSSHDQMPNVSRNGLEIVFASDRPGGAGGMDVYKATRKRMSDPWSAPVNVGAGVNTSASETRPSLSGDGTRLHFGRLGDIWVSTRS